MKLYRRDSSGKLRPVHNWEWKVWHAVKPDYKRNRKHRKRSRQGAQS